VTLLTISGTEVLHPSQQAVVMHVRNKAVRLCGFRYEWDVPNCRVYISHHPGQPHHQQQQRSICCSIDSQLRTIKMMSMIDVVWCCANKRDSWLVQVHTSRCSCWLRASQ